MAPDRYAVIGHPVAHSRSPFIHALFARETGQTLSYERLDVPPAGFQRAVREFFTGGGKGLNVTVPHKEAAAALVDDRSPAATLAKAVNTIRQSASGALIGDNTDGVGLLRDLEQHFGLTLAGMRVLILGAGGAARGVLGPLLERRLECLVIANRTAARAAELAAEFGAIGAVIGAGFGDIEARPFDLIINATAASLAGEVPPIPAGVISAKTVCYDMAYAAGDTAFTHLARQSGAAAAHQGFGMLVEQAAESFYLWRGVRPATAPVLNQLLSEVSRAL